MIDKRYFICEICGKVFTPASNLRKHIVTTMGRNHYFGPNLCWLWLQFQLERLKMVHTKKKFFFQVCLDVVSTFQYEHIVHLDFSLVLSYTVGISPLWKSWCVSSRLWVWWNVCHNFFNVCIGKAFTSVSFYVHLQVVSTKRRFYAYLSCRKPFSSKQWPCGPSNSSDIRKLLHNICICQHFLQK